MLGTEVCHHFQSAGLWANVLPDAVVISVESYVVSSGRPVQQRQSNKIKSSDSSLLRVSPLVWPGGVSADDKAVADDTP